LEGGLSPPPDEPPPPPQPTKKNKAMAIVKNLINIEAKLERTLNLNKFKVFVLVVKPSMLNPFNEKLMSDFDTLCLILSLKRGCGK
jgi:hypothetical protein